MLSIVVKHVRRGAILNRLLFLLLFRTFLHVDLLKPFICINYLLFQSSFSCFSLWMRPWIDIRFTVWCEQFELKLFSLKSLYHNPLKSSYFPPFFTLKNGILDRCPRFLLNISFFWLKIEKKNVFYFIQTLESWTHDSFFIICCHSILPDVFHGTDH